MITIDRILRESGVLSIPKPNWLADYPFVHLSKANQLLGTWDALTKYRSKNYAAYGKQSGQESWQAHHIFEDRELDYLDVREKFPPKAQCLCVNSATRSCTNQLDLCATHSTPCRYRWNS